MPAERTTTGAPIPGTDVNLTDAVAYLSGVNYGSVVKVVAAINAILTNQKLAIPAILHYDSVPTTPVNPYDRGQEDRVSQTDILVRNVVTSGATLQYECLDKPTAKFAPKAARVRVGLTD